MAVYDDQQTEQPPGDTHDQGWYKDEATKLQAPTDDVEASGSNESKSLDSNQLGQAEAGASSAEKVTESFGQDTNPTDQETSFVYKSGGRGFSAKSFASNKKLWLAGAGGGGVIVLFLFIFLLLGQLKVISFSNVLASAGFARFSNILQERYTQDIFDASVVQNGSVATNTTLFDKFRQINPNDRLSELGRSDQLRFVKNDDNTLNHIQIGDKQISPDGVAKNLGYDKPFEQLSAQDRATVRYNYVNDVKGAVDQTFSEESSAVRSRLFGYIADEVGFSFSRWKQLGRNLFGKSPPEAQVDDMVEQYTETTGGTVNANTGINEIDQFIADDTKPANVRLQVQLAQRSGEIDASEAIVAAYKADLSTAQQIGSAATNIGTGALVISLACMANVAVNKITSGDTAKANEKQAEHMGLELLAAGSQAKTGDVYPEAYQATAQEMDGAEQSPYYQYLTGAKNIEYPANYKQPLVRPVMFDQTLLNTVKAVTSPSTYVTAGLSNIPGISDLLKPVTGPLDQHFCNAILSPAGLITTAVASVAVQVAIGIFSAGGGTEVATATGDAVSVSIVSQLGKAVSSTVTGAFEAKSLATIAATGLYALGLQYVVQLLAHNSYSGLETGPGLFERQAQGVDLVQNQQTHTMLYGRPLMPSEVSPVDKASLTFEQQSFSQKSAFTRYFSVTNPYSLATTFVASMPTSFGRLDHTIQQHFLSLGSIASGILSPLRSLTGLAFAASNTPAGYDPHAGIEQFGYSSDEINKIQHDPSYGLQQNSVWVENYNANAIINKQPTLDDLFGACFSPTMTQYEAEQMSTPGTSTYNSNCSASRLSQDDAFHYRAYQMDNYISGDLSRRITNAAPQGT